MNNNINYTEPKEFNCMDDSPLNNGWGYQDEFEEEDDENIPDEEE